MRPEDRTMSLVQEAVLRHMLKYTRVIYGEWIERVNRFLARVYVSGEVELVHVKNTGRLRELFQKGVKVALQTAEGVDGFNREKQRAQKNDAGPSTRSTRKTRFSVIAVYVCGQWVNVDSQAPNQVVSAALDAGTIDEFGMVSRVKREVQYAQSRFDIYYESDELRGFIEVKGVTLVHHGVAKFPDAPTLRGAKHAAELAASVKQGYRASVLFLIQRADAYAFMPYREQDPRFSKALEYAAQNGVQVLAYTSHVEADSIELGHPVPVVF